MRIISQNKLHSIDFDRVHLWRQYKTIYANFGSDTIMLGQYKSDERSEAVFEDIHNAYAPVGIIATNLNEAQARQFIGSDNIKTKAVYMNEPDCAVTTYESFIYRMPSE
jgi:hypothetical protein